MILFKPRLIKGSMLKTIPKGLLIIFTIFSAAVTSPAVSDEEPYLFTEDEAKELRYSDKEWEKESVPKQEPDTLDRPSIIVEKPDVVDTDKGPTILAIDPANVFIVIKRNESPLDPGTIQVWAEKFIFKIDVTDRVLKYFTTTGEGAILHAKSIHIPKGRFKVGMSIADVNGNKTEKKYLLRVE